MLENLQLINYISTSIWYFPIFAVQNPNTPGKFRIVYDAAATVNGVLLNSVALP